MDLTRWRELRWQASALRANRKAFGNAAREHVSQAQIDWFLDEMARNDPEYVARYVRAFADD